MAVNAEAEIRELMGTLTRAWNAQDWPTFTACFTADSHYVSAAGKVLLGRPQIGAFLLTAGVSHTTVALEEMQVRLPAPDAAVLLYRWTLTAPEGPGNTRQGIFTGVAVRGAAGWKLAALHNAETLPESPAV
jgi:uncharacterized protein (TIGR02246 family)